MNWQQRISRSIYTALTSEVDNVSLAKRILRCNSGICNKCGDLCPLRAQQWLHTTSPLITRALANSPTPLIKVRFTKPDWGRDRGALAAAPLSLMEKEQTQAEDSVKVSSHAIEKALRRTFDKLQLPSVIVAGMFDAWYGDKRWEVGAELLIAGAPKSALYDAFPLGDLAFEDVLSLRRSLQSLLTNSHEAKRHPTSSAFLKVPVIRQREYYKWLASVAPNARLFRYGCDRYFNPLIKMPKVSKPVIPKKRGYPHQLVRSVFGNHPLGCQCIPCGGLGRHHEGSQSR